MYCIQDIKAIPGTHQAIFQIDQMQCLALNQCAPSTFSHNHQFRSPKSTKTKQKSQSIIHH